MSGGREKIEIIRKKSDKNKNMTFEWKGDGDMMGPESLDMSGMDGDMTHMKIIRKKTKVDRKKDGKQIEVKVEAEENN